MSKGIVIETKNLRQGGSIHQMGDGTPYHFRPNEHGHHVCVVKNREHAKRFLKIDGFEPYMANDGDDDDEDEVSEEETIVVADIDEDDEVTLDEPKDDAPPAPPAPPPAPVDLSSLDDVDLAKLHVEAVGRPPHPNAKRETIEAKIKEAQGQAPAA